MTDFLFCFCLFRETESVVIRSSRTFHNSTSAVAFCILNLYPLSLHNHFVATVSSSSTTPPISTDVVNDMFVISYSRSSMMKFYDLNDVISNFLYEQKLDLKQPVRYTNC